MADSKKEVEKANTTLSAWDKFRLFIKNNKEKIIGGFTAIIAYLAGDGTMSSCFQALWSAIFGG